ncbi:extracellular solute-binding protein [Hydrogenimonas sp.]
MKKETLWTILGVIVVLALVWLGYPEEGGEGVKTKKRPKPTVMVYVSEDRVFSEPILKEFEKKTGIVVNAVYDTEETKSTGVMNRLLAEKSRPQADVYWANEPIRAEVLKQKGVLAPYASKNCEGIPESFKDSDGYWCGFSARVRLLVAGADLAPKPDSIFDYTDPAFKGKGVLANPLFGTTTAHMAALFVVLGEERAEAFMKAMHKNGVMMSSSNGESADLVAMGHAGFALVDSDDAVARLRKGAKIAMIYPDQKEGELGVFVVPNAVMLVKGAPHPKAAKKLIDYLLSPEVEAKLAQADCAQIPLHAGVEGPKELLPMDKTRIMKVDYGEVAKTMLAIQPFLRQWAGL